MTSISTRSQAKKTLGDVEYTERADFPNGLLPTCKDIIENMLYLLRPKRAGQVQRSKKSAAKLLADIVQEHWLFCNVYTIRNRHIADKVLKLYDQFTALLQTRKSRQKKKYFDDVDRFNKNTPQLFDIFCTDEMKRKRLEEAYGVKMTQVEFDFLEDQRSLRKMFCDDFVDRKWKKSMERRRQDLDSLEKLRQESLNETMQSVSSVDAISGSDNDSEHDCMSEYDNNENDEDSSSDYEIRTSTPCTYNVRKRARLESPHSSSQSETNNMPYRYRHLRDSERKVKPKLYETIDHLKSKYHMSETQAEASIVTVGNNMFDCQWKFHSESEVIDLDTLPQKKNIINAGKSLEALVLDEIAKEMIASNEKITITYCDDGSKKQGCGSFSVQGITINGKYRSLPTLNIASESRENLADLKLTILNMLAAASGVETKSLFEKIDFVVTDQTAHNFNVNERVASKLDDSEHMPDHLFCNVHPTLMFNRVIKKQWSEIESVIGKDKIYSSFLINATTSSSCVTEQALDCVTRLINHDYDHKSWNYANEFDDYISPKTNKSVSLKDERFNRLTLTCAVCLYHLEDVASFLNKFEHVTNQLACIVRCLMDIEFLTPLFCAGALLGLHLIEPFVSLTTASDTTYSKLIPAFNQLYDDLQFTDPKCLLDTNNPAFKFISRERFLMTRYDDDICQVIQQAVMAYETQVVKVIQIMLPQLAAGFQNQKGAIFGFAEENEHSLSQMNQEKLDQAPVNNIPAERSVGFINYELTLRGAKQLQSASSSQVKCKSSDLIESRPSGSFREYTKISQNTLPEIMKEWNDKQEALVKQGLQKKEIANIAVDKRRNKDLEALKKMGGPFTSGVEVEQYLQSDIDNKVKVDRFYLEVRYARDTALSLPKTSDIFRLLKDYKKLPVETYASNLILYLNNVTSKADATMQDFNSAVDAILHL